MNQSRRLRHVLQAAIVLLLTAFLLPGLASAAEEEEREYEDLLMEGDNVCTRCHDDADNPKLMTIGATKHGTSADPRTPTCTSCHGESLDHRNNPDGTDERPLPDVTFKKNKHNSAVEMNASCEGCHQGGDNMFWAASVHQVRDVACVDCHDMHTTNDLVRQKVSQTDVCANCHKAQRSQENKPYRHPTREGMMACSDCHNPHGSVSNKGMLVRDSVIDTCYTCHMEKRGPFLWSHQPVTEDCTICHNPHGTTVNKMLKVRVPFLCQQCHEPTGHRGAIPEVGPRTNNSPSSRNIVMARGCLNCHTNIHGGNNPTGNTSRGRALFK